MNERPLDAPVLQQLRHQIDGVALADAAEVQPHAIPCRADRGVVGIQFERRQPGADGDVERAARQFVHMARDEQALHRRRSEACGLARRQMVDPRDVAVGAEAAQLPLEAIHEVEGRLRRLRRIPLVGMHGVHLEDGGHRLVRKTADVAELARSRDPESAVDVRPTCAHEGSGPERESPAPRSTATIPRGSCD